eukprot:CAMPEP_0119010862 /NCGR_PEP_ID=MMETSP1176-20130426/5303_1 /TAXON_ID=265551 /ORGANISM="Synedropsis recta cf, Strain CCMP1620" /LENGTH=210 /DNA_ID=CAMNT_0006963603 /DNA_START=37 /DNA_END=669 /DNA_ORIENTATION=+
MMMMLHTTRAASPLRLIGGVSRTFFASSTDHTTLLQDADVHCIPLDDGLKQYVLAASGMEEAMVKKVPQLHLARIYLKEQTVYGAKVVNKTLGDIPSVCGRLLDAAKQDGGRQARSMLHGLSDWVLAEKLSDMQDAEAKVVAKIADGNLDSYNEKMWEQLALEYVNQGLGDEANLYLEKDATLIRIEHQADTSEFANTSGGTMAIFEFNK